MQVTLARWKGYIMSSVLLIGIGTATSEYDPDITAARGTVSLHSEGHYMGVSPIGNPALLLLVNEVNGNVETACTGGVTSFNLQGKLTWSDGSHSVYDIDSTTNVRAEGISAALASGSITSGHFSGKRITCAGVRIPSADQLAACLAGGLSASTGASVIRIHE